MEDKKTKDLIRQELHKLSNLSGRERLGYIWDYYKPLMAAVIVGVILISSAISIYRNAQMESLLNVYFINTDNVFADAQAMAAEFESLIGGLEKNQEIILDTSMAINQDGSQYSMASQTKMTALASAKSIDIMVMDEETFEYYYEAGFFADLSERLTEEQLEKWSKLLIKRVPAADSKDSGKASVIAAIDLSEAPMIEKYKLYSDTKLYGGVFSQVPPKEIHNLFFEFIMNE